MCKEKKICYEPKYICVRIGTPYVLDALAKYGLRKTTFYAFTITVDTANYTIISW